MLIDKTNWHVQAPILRNYITKAKYVGFDVETHDDNRHQGLNDRCGYDPKTRKKTGGKTKPLIFDFRRMTLCGASFYTEEMPEAVYINVGHADVENRVSLNDLRDLMLTKLPEAVWIAHNAAYEICVAERCLDLKLAPSIICTMQMAVSAHGPAEYDHTAWLHAGVGGIGALIPALVEHSATGIDPMSPELEDIVYKIIGKESSAEHSYNGLAASIAYGYGLKQLVKSFFGHKMRSFEETLGDAAHMGQLMGEQVAAYGADDAYWAVRLFRALVQRMAPHPGLLRTFLEQENPMVPVYAGITLDGLKIDHEAVEGRFQTERGEAAKTLRELRTAIRRLLPFPEKPNTKLVEREGWYEKNWLKYRTNIEKWAALPPTSDDLEEIFRAAGSVSSGVANEEGTAKSTGPNFSHYMPVRTLLYDLIGAKVVTKQGKVQSDADHRGKIKDILEKEGKTDGAEILRCLTALSGIDQRMKLYLWPYRQLVDPETHRVYPTTTSMLATRRMGMRHPNGMQLAKRGESTYIRGFYQGDTENDVIISCDWSAIELVEIGEFSGDPEFVKAFAQIPHDDLHSGAAADILEVEVPDLTVEAFKGLPHHQSWNTFLQEYPLPKPDKLMLNLKGESIDPVGAYKYWRTEIGKGANFNYWYSGWLATIGERMGWSSETTAEATERYRNRFPMAEAWRVALIEQVARDGFITLPDHHRYVRYEATPQWFNEWCAKFGGSGAYADVIRWMGKKISKRAGNQTVNAMIQGSCATLAKRSILRIIEDIVTNQIRARFMMPVHDELVFSCHRNDAAAFIPMMRERMITHPDMFKLCQLDASPSIGLTFEPWHEKKAPLGQIELNEAPKALFPNKAGQRLDVSEYQYAIDWLFEQRNGLKLAA